MAPESLDNREFSPATDVWSFGVLLWEMYYPNQLPYAELGIDQLFFKLDSGHRLSIPPAYPSIVVRIMKTCWQEEPEKRPSFQLISSLLTKLITINKLIMHGSFSYNSVDLSAGYNRCFHYAVIALCD